MRGVTHRRRLVPQHIWLAATLVMPTTRPAIEVQGFHMVESKGQKRSMEVEARKARVFKPENITALDIVRALVWGKSEKPFDINGEIALIDADTQDLEMPTRADILSPDGILFKTTDLLYEARARRIGSLNPVEAMQARSSARGAHLTGKGLTIHLDENTYEILAQVRAEQSFAKGSSLVIQSKHLLILPDERGARFSRAVQVKSADVDLKGDRLMVYFEPSEDGVLVARRMVLDSPADSRPIQANLKSMKVRSKGLTLELDPAQGTLSRSEALGQVDAVTSDNIQLKAESLVSETVDGVARILLKDKVTILTGSRKGECEEATIYPDSGDIVLERLATVTEGDQVLHGERIRLSTKRSDIVVEKVKGSMDRKRLGI